MTKEETINELIAEAERIKYEHNNKSDLDKLIQRTTMHLKEMGESDETIEYIKNIKFKPRVMVASTSAGSSQEKTFADCWRNGIEKLINTLTTVLEKIEVYSQYTENKDDNSFQSKSNKIFVAHGHDKGMQAAVARCLENWGLEAVILHERPDEGRTVIEKLEEEISDCQFAIVLLSPDDISYPATDDPSNQKHRPRQNVVFELGYSIGRLGRGKVFLLCTTTDIEILTDYQGVIYTRFDDAGGWERRLSQELKKAGYNIDSNS